MNTQIPASVKTYHQTGINHSLQTKLQEVETFKETLEMSTNELEHQHRPASTLRSERIH